MLAINEKRAIFILTFCVFLAVSQIQAAVTIDARSAGGAADNAGLASLTWSHAIGGGASRALLVGVSTATTVLPASLPANRVQTVSYGGFALTRVGTIVSSNSLNASEIFVLTNPPIGTANVTATFSTTAAAIPVVFVNQAVGNSISFFGVSQTAPTGAFFSATGIDSQPTVNVGDSAAGDFVFDNLAVSPAAGFVNPPAASNQTVCSAIGDETTCTRGRRFFNFAYDVGAASTEPGAAPTVTMNWQMTGADAWALGALAIRQSTPTAANVSVDGRVLSSAAGRGVARARVTLIDANGAAQSTLTNFFGRYRFANVRVGETYILNIFSKQHRFAPQIIHVNENSTELTSVAQP